MHEASLLQGVQRPVDRLRPAHPNRRKSRQHFIGGQRLPGRSAQDAEHEILVA